MKNEVIHIFSNADEVFYPGLAVSVLSCLYAATGSYDYHFHILDGGITAESKQELAEKIQLAAITTKITALLSWHEINLNEYDCLPLVRGSRMTYTKFFIPQLLKNIDTAIHIDADVLFGHGIEQLWQAGSESEFILTGVRDYHHSLENECPVNNLSSEEKTSPYINAGIMRLDLNTLRSMDIIGLVEKFARDYSEIRKGDQTIFNYLCRNQINLLPENNNFCMSLGTGMQVANNHQQMNLHYIGGNKPWLKAPETKQFFAYHLWWEFAQEHQFNFAKNAKLEKYPSDIKNVQKKRWLNILNPKRSKYYCDDLKSAKLIHSNNI